jgi:hypothetical protein
LRRLLAIASFLSLAAAPIARGANIVVETTADGVTGPLCDIRDALRSAEDDQPTGGCQEVEPNGADTIDLTGLTGTIELENGVLLTIHSDVTIVGPGARVLAIDGLDANPIFVVGSAGTLTIAELTIANGSSEGRGACIDVDGGTLALRDSRVTSCSGFNGGGIAVDGGTARLDRVLVDANSAGNSGAGLINSESVVAINDSTFSGNVAVQAGGGVATFGHDGGGVATTTLIHSSTLADNGAETGANLFNAGDSDPLVETFLTHVLLANPRGVVDDCGGSEAVTSQGYNLATDASCALAAIGDQPSTAAGIEATLEDNGGPTATHRLLAGSAAIDGGNPAGCTDTIGVAYEFDQRGPGFPRRTNGNGDLQFECDIGAYETAPEPVAAAVGIACWVALGALAQRRRRGNAHACAAAPASSVATKA